MPVGIHWLIKIRMLRYDTGEAGLYSNGGACLALVALALALLDPVMWFPMAEPSSVMEEWGEGRRQAGEAREQTRRKPGLDYTVLGVCGRYKANPDFPVLCGSTNVDMPGSLQGV